MRQTQFLDIVQLASLFFGLGGGGNKMSLYLQVKFGNLLRDLRDTVVAHIQYLFYTQTIIDAYWKGHKFHTIPALLEIFQETKC